MKKKLFIVLFFCFMLLIVSTLNSCNNKKSEKNNNRAQKSQIKSEEPIYGYKDFKWGDDIKNVRQKAKIQFTDYDESLSGAFLIAYGFQYRELYEGATYSSPIMYVKGKIERYKGEDETTYFFLNSKLIGVSLRFFPGTYGGNVLQELGAKYGDITTVSVSGTNGDCNVKAWFNNPGRVVTYCEYVSMGWGESVTYFDRNIYEKAAEIMSNERKTELNKLKNKIE